MLDDDLYRSEDLQEVRSDGGIFAIENTRFQITLYHDFKRLKGSSEFKPVLPDWREEIERARSRTKYLTEKLKALNCASNRLLFVRYGDDISPPGLAAGVSGQEATGQLLRALYSRFDRAAFDLMCIEFGTRLDNPDPRLIYCNVPDQAPVWQGTDHLWSQAFDQIGARLQPSLLDQQQAAQERAETEAPTEVCGRAKASRASIKMTASLTRNRQSELFGFSKMVRKPPLLFLIDAPHDARVPSSRILLSVEALLCRIPAWRFRAQGTGSTDERYLLDTNGARS